MIARALAFAVTKPLRKWRARRVGMPYFISAFWPPYYLAFGGETPGGSTVCLALYDTAIGDTAPVFKCDRATHFYRLCGRTRASGSDHIVSPWQFDIEYAYSRPEPRP